MTFNKYILFACLVVMAISSRATHIVGGEMNYRCLGNNTFEISLTVFRDCQNGVPFFDNPASIGVFDQNNNFITQLLLPFTGDDTLSPFLFHPCLVIPPDACVHRTTYIDTLNLPFLAGGYQLAYQRCCRNHTIVNIIAPNSTGATFYTYISENALTNCNNSAVFNTWPPIYICAGEAIVFDHSASDLDGDSLVYELCAPFRGANTVSPNPQPPFSPPYDSINWKPPYNTSNMMGGVPLKIDRQTGLLTGIPFSVGQFVVGICVKEYRNGLLISTTKRDFQYNVGACGVLNTSAFFVPDVVCDSTLTVNFQNQSSGSGIFSWYFGDPTTSSDTSSIQNPIYTYPDTGLYQITLVVGYNQTCPDTFSRTISVQYRSLDADFDVVYDPCSDSTVAQFFDTSTDTYSQPNHWVWDFYDGSTSQSPNPTLLLQGQTDYDVRVLVTAANGCQDFHAVTLPVRPAEIRTEAGVQICRGAEMTLEVFNLDSTDVLTYRWFPENKILNDPTENLIFVEPFLPTAFWVQATNQFGCNAYDTLFIPISTNTPPLSITADKDSIFPGESVQLFATPDPDYLYLWSPDSILNATTILNPVATTYFSSFVTLQIEDENGCLNFDSLWIQIRTFECDEPYLFVPSAFTPNNDGHNDRLFVRANSITEFYFAVYNRWGERVFETTDLNTGWDGTYKGLPLPADVFGYYLRVRCYDGGFFFRKGNISLIR